MKLKKLLLSAAVLLCMTVCLCTSALAVDWDDPRFKDKTWEQIMEDFLAAHGTEANQITAGYYNTVTGEEHYHNKDTLMYGASMAKLPTNMLYAERISKGEMEFSTKIGGTHYQNLQYLSLVNSDNPAMDTMVRDLGGGSYAAFRKTILPYIGVAEEDATSDFLARNFFTPEQILHCLKLLYGNEEKYPGVEYCMTLASPYDYFKQNQPPYVVAHKYGWYTDNGITYLNDSAIVYTTEPILIVMFTANVKNNREVLADYCSLMCDYAQYSRLHRYVEEATEKNELAFSETYNFLTVNNPASVSAEYPQWQYYTVGAGGAILLIALLVMIRKKLLGLLLILIALATAAVGIAPTALAYYSVQEKLAEQTVAAFEDAFATDSRGIEHLTDCDAAMEHSDADDLQTLVTNKVADSFALTIGNAELKGNHITVPVTVTKVDLEAFNAELEAALDPELSALLRDVDVYFLYDEAGEFVPDHITQAQQNAFDKVIAGWDKYLYTEDGTLTLTLNIPKTITN
ncbi:MAG: hypothetical protein IJD81_06235, partial [Oscillospiraceae bacterium]|nr:hypothetical protein [Oscillospiraceae bacterium]